MLSIGALPIFKHRERKQKKKLEERQHRRRKCILLLAICALSRRRNSKRHAGRPYPIKRKRRPNFWRVVRRMNGKQFKTSYRLTCYQFRTLVGILRAKLDRNKMMAERSSGSIQAEVKVALLLRILAGASYSDLCLIFDIPTSTVYDLFHRTLKALLCTFKMSGIPEEEEKLKEMALKFKVSRGGGNPLNGCIGALDGIAIKIRKPNKKYHPALYYCRKGFYAIPVQAMVDSDYRFRSFSALCVGATHDSLSHSISALGRFLREGKLMRPFWIAADEAYICTEFLLTPFACSQFDRSALSKYKDAFNFFHSSLRMHVEQAFGLLVNRFGILWRPLRFSLQTNTMIVLAAMLLHNFCIDNSDGVEPQTMSAVDKRMHSRAFKLWYQRSRTYILQQHDIATLWRSARTEEDRAMQKSGTRRGMVNLLTSIRLTRPYGQDRFDTESENSLG